MPPCTAHAAARIAPAGRCAGRAAPRAALPPPHAALPPPPHRPAARLAAPAPRLAASCSGRAVRAAAAAGGAGGASDPSISDAQAVAVLDGLIDNLLSAADDASFTSLVTANVLSFDVKFFLRVAARADSAAKGEKAQLSSLANRTMLMMDGIVKQTRRQMSSSQEVLTKLVAAAADDGTGAFVLPLRADRIVKIREVLAQYNVDEAVISNAYAWMRKASDDGACGVWAGSGVRGRARAHAVPHRP
jgi:hypothetical protein